MSGERARGLFALALVLANVPIVGRLNSGGRRGPRVWYAPANVVVRVRLVRGERMVEGMLLWAGCGCRRHLDVCL